MFDVNKDYLYYSVLEGWRPARFVCELKNNNENSNKFCFTVLCPNDTEVIKYLYKGGRDYINGEIVIKEKRNKIWIGPLGQICGKEVAGWDCYEKVDT